MAYYRCGPTAIGSRASWSVTSPVEPKSFERPLSGNYDRIFNAFERTNAFEYVKSTFEGKEERHSGSTDVIVNRKMSSSFERADCALAAQTPCSDDEDFRERALYSQARQLFPLQEDLADWINKTIGITYLTGENFLDVLDNGAELCQLATVIQEKAREAFDQGLIVGPVPAIRGRCWQRAARRSFFSRDNAENFITFCRELGVHENLLFESDDLVLHNQPRQVVVCLLEVARVATRFRVEPPGLVALETEIALEERDSGLGAALSPTWQFRAASPHSSPTDSKTISNDEADDSEGCVADVGAALGAGEAGGAGGADGADEAEAASVRSDSDSDTDVPLRPTNELDKRVQSITRLLERGCSCGAGKCSRMLKVKKLGEGRYNIAGRNVFIRLLKGRHMMVRVGGGWDTLEHFLSRHEPCQVRLVVPGRRDLLPLPAPAPATVPAPATAPAPAPAPASAPAPAPEPASAPSPTPTPVSPASSRASLSKESSITSLSPAQSRTSISGKSSPVEPKPRRLNGKVSPPERAAPARPGVARNRSALTLPLDSQKPDARARKQSAPASFSTPSTPINRSTEQRKSFNAPKKSRSMSLAQEEKKVAGAERALAPKGRSAALEARKTRSQSLATTPVNEPRKGFTGAHAKKTRSMSLAGGGDFAAPLKKSASSGAALSQAAIEESIRRSLEASIADPASPKKPFLHIKAKYRSPPPREVPPR